MKKYRVEIICTGSELLSGKVNTHTAYLGIQLEKLGLSVAREHTVGDDPALMRETFSEAWRRSDVVITCGGLGPTFDDLTRDVWSKVTGRKLKSDPALVAGIKKKFLRRHLSMPPMNKRQALVLKGAEVINNDFGTAPGQYLQIGKKILVLLPGPTREMRPMVENFLMHRLEKATLKSFLVTRMVHIVGVPESLVDKMIRPIVSRYKRVEGCSLIHGILASNSIVTVKFTVQGNHPIRTITAAQIVEHALRKRLGDIVFGSNNDTLSSVIGSALKKSSLTLAVAESCTGGLLAKLITDEPGASNYFEEGIVTYTNERKIKRLGVPSRLLKSKGAVSEETARAMALGLRRSVRVDYALSITGIAGPAGGTVEKPVGLVFIACAGPRRTLIKRFQFDGEREWIRHRSALMALDILRRELVR